MMWHFRKRQNPEIDPDEIFLDSHAAFDQTQLEGRLEQPLPESTFFFVTVSLALLFIVLIFRTANLQIVQGDQYAARSLANSLDVLPIFAPRGIITDMHGVVLAENIQDADGRIVRHYTVPALSHVIGYVSRPKKDAKGVYYDTNTKGVVGLEARHNDYLEGVNGKLLAETDALGDVRSAGIIEPARTGGTLRLSLDAELEKHFAEAMTSIARDKGFIAGAGVVLDVETGAVRALVSYPIYDANVLSSGGPAATIAAYNTDPGHPFMDHVIQGIYTPGSVVKPIVAAGALTDGIITSSTHIDDPGKISISDPYRPGKNFVYTGWKALGAVDVRRALAWSSDIFFYEVGGGYKSQKGLGIERLKYWYTQFGLGVSTGIDIPGEASGTIPDPAWKRKVFKEAWYQGDTYFTAIGQYSVQVTPLQMARAIAAVANGGKLVTPTLVEGATPTHTIIPVDQSALRVVREGMRECVTSALCGRMNFEYLSVAGKTGTAQTGSRNQYDNSWIVGFFPYEKPQYAFAVVLERGPAGAGSQAVVVMQQLFESLHADGSSYVGS